MKKIFFFFFCIILSNSLKAMNITNVTVSSINTQDLNVRLNVSEGVVFTYTESNFEVNGNTIMLTACYIMGLGQSAWSLQNDIVTPAINGI